MTDVLAIVGPVETEDQLLDELARRHPDRITVLVEDSSSEGAPDAKRGRFARLLDAIERRTGAVIVGLVEDRCQLIGWRFDRVVGGGSPLPV